MSFRGAPPEDDAETIYADGGMSEEEMDEKLASHEEMPYQWDLGYGVVCILVGFLANVAQFGTSAAGTVELGFSFTSGNLWTNLTNMVGNPDPVATIAVNTSTFWMWLIAGFLALASQVYIHKHAQTAGAMWIRVKTAAQKKVSVKRILQMAELEDWVWLISLGGNMITDAVFAESLSHNPAVTFLWVVIVSGTSTFLFYRGITSYNTGRSKQELHEVMRQAERDALVDNLKAAYAEEYGYKR